MAATTGFKSNLRPRVFVHATTAPTVDNIAATGSIWVNVTGPKLYVATAQGAGGTTTTWTTLI